MLYMDGGGKTDSLGEGSGTQKKKEAFASSIHIVTG